MTGSNVNSSSGGGSARTPSSLLERARSKDQEAWRRLVHLYSPVVYGWCRRGGLQEADAADVGQEVFQAVAGGLARFRHEKPEDSFRAWLRTITINKIRDFLRRQSKETGGVGGSDAQRALLEIPETKAEEIGATEDEQHIVFRRAVELVLEEFSDRTRDAFLRVVMERCLAGDVARELDMTVNAVYLAKSRVLRRIREEFAGLIDGLTFPTRAK